MLSISAATTEDACAILELQKMAFQSEARIYNDWSLPPLTQTDRIAAQGVLQLSHPQGGGRGPPCWGSVRGRQNGDTCAIGRLIVHPSLQGQGIGSLLLRSIEERFADVAKYELFAGSRSEANIRLYQRRGYTITRTQQASETASLTFLEKRAERKEAPCPASKQ